MPRAESPVRNGGSNAQVPDDLTADLAGGPRIVGSSVDIGATNSRNARPRCSRRRPLRPSAYCAPGSRFAER